MEKVREQAGKWANAMPATALIVKKERKKEDNGVGLEKVQAIASGETRLNACTFNVSLPVRRIKIVIACWPAHEKPA